MSRFLNRILFLFHWPKGWRFALAWHAASVITSFLVATMLLLLDPIDADRGIGERGRVAFYKVMAFAYPQDRSPKMLVIEVDRTFLDQYEYAPPLPYDVHAAALEQIAAMRPRAIFVDFTFVNVADKTDRTIDTLVATIRRIARTTPIYLAAAAEGPIARPEIAALLRVDNVHFVSVRAAGEEGGYPLERDRGRLPAALAIHEDLCAQNSACTIQDRPGQEMDVWWGVHRPPPNLEDFNCRGALADDCDRAPSGVIERVFTLARGALFGWANPEWVALDPVTIQYAPTLSLADVFVAQKLVRRQIAGGVVFYGANNPTSDRSHSPVHSDFSGVQQIAMAYDNLEALGGHYIRMHPPFGLDFKAHTIMLCAIMSLASFIMRAWITRRRLRRRVRPHHQTHFFRGVDSIVFLFVVTAIAIFEFSVLHVGPLAWAPVLVATMAGEFLSHRIATAPLTALMTWNWRTARLPHTLRRKKRLAAAAKAKT